MISIAATVVIVADGKVLLVKREDLEVWALPGGGVDEGESLAETAVREAYEETGVQVELTHLIGLYSEIGSWSDWHVASFAAAVVGGELQTQLGEVLDLRFFPLEALPEDMFWWHRQQIEDFQAGLGGSGVSRQEVMSRPGAANRAELYAMRDQSGLTRREFYHWYYHSDGPLKRTRQVK